MIRWLNVELPSLNGQKVRRILGLEKVPRVRLFAG